MSLVTFVATYILLWWLFFFMALPWGNRPNTQVIQGQDPGAPSLPRLGVKVGVVSLVTLGVCLGLHIMAPFWGPLLHQWLK